MKYIIEGASTKIQLRQREWKMRRKEREKITQRERVTALYQAPTVRTTAAIDDDDDYESTTTTTWVYCHCH